MATPLVLRVVESKALTYRRVWKASVFSYFLSPVLFLVAMGFGLGSLVDRGDGSATIEAASYVAFLAPGLMVASAMQAGTGEGSFPVMAGMKWIKTYHAALATPIGARGLVGGHFAWIGIKMAIIAIVFGAVATVLGAMSVIDVLAVTPVAILTGLAMAAPMTAFTATRETTEGLTAVFRFLVTPMFLFSGTFFPIDVLPGWLQPLAYITPLWHAVEIARRFALGWESALPIWQHSAYLMVLFAVGAGLSTRFFTRKLLP